MMTTADKYEITGVQFGVWSAADIERQAPLDLTDFGCKSTNSNAFYDGRFGAVSNGQACFDCRQSSESCSGHWGMIKLGIPIPNPFFIKDIKNILQCFCRKCSTLLYPRDRIELNNMHTLEGEDRIKEICAILIKSNGTFFCPNAKCNTPVNEIIVRDEKNFMIRYSNEEGKKGKKKELPLDYEEIYQMFKNISNDDLITVGLNNKLINDAIYLDKSTFTHGMMAHRHQNRPEDFFITILPVLPLCIRSCLSQGKDIKHDGATILYQLILKAVKHLKEAKNEKEVENARDTIQKHIFALFKQKGDDGTKKSYNSMFNRLSGKEGHVRGGVEAKRANFGGRSVVGNAPHLPFGAVELPQEMTKISQIEYIISANLSHWNRTLQNDKRMMALADANYKKLRAMKKQPIYLTQKPFIFYEPQIQYVVRGGRKIGCKFVNLLVVGDMIHRKLVNGDMCIINRQPTIRKESFNAHRIFVCPKADKRTICIPLPNCSAYNMD